MKAFLLFLVVFLISCFQEDPKITLVKKFWQAIDTRDVEQLKQLISEPQQAEFIRTGEVDFNLEKYEVLDISEQGVNVKFVRHCYSDIVASTILSDKEGQLKIDLFATIQAQIKMLAGEKPTKKYCYNFEDQALQGVINGKPWQVHHMNREIFDFGTRKEEPLALVAEACPDDNSGFLSLLQQLVLSKKQ